MNKQKLIPIVFVVLLTIGVTWGTFQVLEEIRIDYTKLSTTAKTWYPLSKAYSTNDLLVGIQPVNITWNSTVAEKKFIISLAGADTSTFRDIVFFDTGIIDVVETTSTGATKLGDTASSGVKWQVIDYILVEIKGTTVSLKSPNGTVLLTVTWNSVPSTLEQIGASGVDKALTNGEVYVAILTDPTEAMTEVINSTIPVIISIIIIAVPLVFLKFIVRFLEKIFAKF